MHRVNAQAASVYGTPQDFGSEDFNIQQGFMVMGLRKRF